MMTLPLMHFPISIWQVAVIVINAIAIANAVRLVVSEIVWLLLLVQTTAAIDTLKYRIADDATASVSHRLRWW